MQQGKIGGFRHLDFLLPFDLGAEDQSIQRIVFLISISKNDE
ncbi:hypothetical protein AmDm5_2145 [Acetobacter malorum]|nr:hypothetical protein AmDm5_2145 [Acetobacter malorum]